MAARKPKPAVHEHASNLAAAESTVAALRRVNALTSAESSLVKAFLSLAAAVDAAPEKADLWREYRAAMSALRGAAEGGSDDDGAAFFAAVQIPGVAKVGNRKKP